MTTDEKFELISQVGEEIITEKELKELIASGKEMIAYDGFEPSGQIHIAQGILRAINVNKMTKSGVKFKMLVADWHAWANHKMGGDMEKIQTVGKYFIEVWKACGMDLENVEFVWASDLVKKQGYWDLVMKIAVKNNLARILRTTQIMGRTESDTLSASQILYPLMQAADIFMLNADITQLGMDQRKVNMLARETAEEVGFKKPIVVSHHMLMGLTQPKNEEADEDVVTRTINIKMSKSNPDSGIYMTDTKADIKRKILKAWAPEAVSKENPILEYCKYILFEKFDSIDIKRPEKFGGNVSYKNYGDLLKDYENKSLHPLDLKNTVIELLDEVISPVRTHFEKDKNAKELLEKVQSFKITR